MKPQAMNGGPFSLALPILHHPEEVLEDLVTMLGVLHLGVELQTVHRTVFDLDGLHRAIV